jgi:hypothetical protein
MKNLSMSTRSWGQKLQVPRAVTEWNVLVSPVGLGNKDHSAGEGQQSVSQSQCPPKLLSSGIIWQAYTYIPTMINIIALVDRNTYSKN